MSKNLITLDTLEPDRDTIEIDGEKYFLRSVSELSITDFVKLSGLAKQLDAKNAGAEIDEDTANKITSFIDGALAILLIDLPVDVRDKLTFDQKMKIIKVFTRGLPNVTGSPTEIPDEKADPPTTVESSQGSGDITAEASTTG